MAGVDRDPDQKAGPRSIGGVRLAGSSRLTFVDASTVQISVSQPVSVVTDAGTRTGRVVIDPGQTVASSLTGPLSTITSMADEADLEPEAWREPGGVIGSRGVMSREPVAATAVFERNWQSSRFPLIGQDVETRRGRGHILALDTTQDLAIVRLASDEDVTLSFGEIGDLDV